MSFPAPSAPRPSARVGLELPFATLGFAASTLAISSGFVGTDGPPGYPVALIGSATAAFALFGRLTRYLFARGSTDQARAGSLAAANERQCVWVVTSAAIAVSAAALAAFSPKVDVLYEALVAGVALLGLGALTLAAVNRVRTATSLVSGLERIAQPHDPVADVEVDLGLGDERWLKAPKLESPYRGAEQVTEGVRGAVFDVQARLMRAALTNGGLAALCLSLLVLALSGRHARPSDSPNAPCPAEVIVAREFSAPSFIPPTEVPPSKAPAPAHPAERPGPTRSLSFASGEEWPSFQPRTAGSLDDFPTSLGPAKNVCVSPQFPRNCPSTTKGAVVYTLGGAGWGAGLDSPKARWIWRGDVTPESPADLQSARFERTFTVGAHPTGSIQIAADDFASVLVNETPVGTIGSVTDIRMAGQAQNVGARFDLTPALRPGLNTITIVAQNGPSAYAGGCDGQPCPYARNPAGVVFAGTLSWSDRAPAHADH